MFVFLGSWMELNIRKCPSENERLCHGTTYSKCSTWQVLSFNDTSVLPEIEKWVPSKWAVQRSLMPWQSRAPPRSQFSREKRRCWNHPAAVADRSVAMLQWERQTPRVPVWCCPSCVEGRTLCCAVPSSLWGLWGAGCTLRGRLPERNLQSWKRIESLQW